MYMYSKNLGKIRRYPSTNPFPDVMTSTLMYPLKIKNSEFPGTRKTHCPFFWPRVFVMCACRNWFFHRAQGNSISCFNFIYLFPFFVSEPCNDQSPASFKLFYLRLQSFRLGFVNDEFGFFLHLTQVLSKIWVQVICTTVHNSTVY